MLDLPLEIWTLIVDYLLIEISREAIWNYQKLEEVLGYPVIPEDKLMKIKRDFYDHAFVKIMFSGSLGLKGPSRDPMTHEEMALCYDNLLPKKFFNTVKTLIDDWPYITYEYLIITYEKSNKLLW